MRHKSLAYKIIAVLMLVTMVMASLGCGSRHKIYKIEDAFDAAANMGAGWSLGNTLDAFNTSIVSRRPSATETCWGNPVATKELIKAVADAGFTTIRIPVTWTGHLDSEGNIDTEWLDRVQEVVDYCYAYKLYVIVNLHHDTGADEKAAWVKAEVDTYNQNLSTFKKVWKQIAERFIDYDGHLLFEGYNEMLDGAATWNYPRKETSYEILNKWAQVFVETVRATGGNNANRNLIVNTYAAAYNEKCLKNFVPPTDSVENHLLVEVHLYMPYEFCDGEVGVVEKHTTFTAAYREYIENTFSQLRSYFIDEGYPVVVGEFAATNKNNLEDRVKYAECYVEQCKKIGAAYIWWDNGSKRGMGLFSRSTYECWFPEIVNAITK